MNEGKAEATYDAALVEWRKASRAYGIVARDYRSRKIGDKEFLAAVKELKKAEEIFDLAETAFIRANAIA